MLLSLLSAFFGILREFFIVKMLGFSSENDYLQIYLSLYFALCLLSDPVRLTYLNLISSRYLSHIMFIIGIVITIFSCTLCFATKVAQPTLQLHLLLIASIDGILAICVSFAVVHKQRFGSYLASQIVNVIPNIFLIPAIFIIYFLPRSLFTINFLFAFFVLHTTQLIILYFIRPTEKNQGKGGGSLKDFLICLRHAMPILGEQIFQIAARLVFLSLGVGFVTLFSLFLKCFITARYIFIDSFIGPKLHLWKFSTKKDIFHTLLKEKIITIVLMLPIALISIIDESNLIFMTLQLSLIFVGAFYLAAIYRITYFKINRFFHYPVFIFTLGTFDLIFAFTIFMIAHYIQSLNPIFLVFLWYIVRLFFEFPIIEKYYATTKTTLVNDVTIAEILH